MKYSLEERFRIITLFYKSGENARETQRRYFAEVNRIVSLNTTLCLKRVFEETKSLHDRKPRYGRSVIRERVILNYFNTNPMNSVEEAVRDILYGPRRNRVTFGTVQRTLNRHRLIPFRIHPMQHLTANQKELRFQFVSQMIIREQDRDPDLFKKVLWTDEATFSTSGMYNRHNVHYWSQVNPRKYQTIKYQGRTSVNVWCGIVNNRIIGPIFFNG